MKQNANLDLIHELRNNGIAVSFIEGIENLSFGRSSKNTPLSIETILTGEKNYRRETIQGREIICPTDSVWDAPVSGIDIRDLPRLEATDRYADALQSMHILPGILPPALKGNPDSPVYTELVSLDPASKILNHLVQLLGKNQRLVFTIERYSPGSQIIYFEEVIATANPAAKQ